MDYFNKRKAGSDIYIMLALFSAFSSGFILLFGKYLVSFQEQQSLFVFSNEYLKDYFLRPGGLIGLSGDFLTQFYFFPAIGVLIVMITISLPVLILNKISKKSGVSSPFSFHLFIPSGLLLIMQMHHYHLLTYNLGFIAVMLLYLLTLSFRGRYSRYAVFILLPLFYYITGAYMFLFLGMYLTSCLVFETGKFRLGLPVLLILEAIVILAVSKTFIFYRPLDQLLLHPLPLVDNPGHRLFFYIATGYLFLYPLLLRSLPSLKPELKYMKQLVRISATLIFAAMAVLSGKMYNNQSLRVMQLQELAYSNKWTDVIELHEESPSENLVGQYFYNIALSETDQLCDRLFSGRQDFGTNSLILPWGNDHLNRGGYFYYSIGLLSEAHRWSYESMVVNGVRVHDLTMLIEINLINGNFRIAEKYVNILKRSLFYNKQALEFEKMLYKPESVGANTDLKKKIALMPDKDFFIQIESPQNNILFLLEEDKNNRKAFEYKMAWFLLQKSVEELILNIKVMKQMGYTQIPVNIEEAVLAYTNSTGLVPDLGGLTISSETQMRFRKYIEAYTQARQNSTTIDEIMREDFGDTFWYYFHFK